MELLFLTFIFNIVECYPNTELKGNICGNN